MPKEREEQFAEILNEALDSGLLLLGESARKAIYFHLKKDFSITKENAAGRMEAFARGLESIFGAGALVIERSILNVLYSKLELSYENNEDSGFVESLKRARDEWLNKVRLDVSLI